ncbi:MAG: peptidase M2 family protein, partial [Deltaproteobacteria bacterium]
TSPADSAKRAELARLLTSMDARYGKAKVCGVRGEKGCLTLEQASAILATSRDYEKLLDVWKRWRDNFPASRAEYARFVELANEGARELGFSDLSEVWNGRYDMTPVEFEAEVDRLWKQVEPLYRQLHCYVRARLAERYGADKVPEGKPIPAHLLGNMWAQEWGNLFDLVAPLPGVSADLDEIIEQAGLDAVGMVKIAERFFTSLGMEPLPATFWKRSMFVRPRDREVVCHASAWDIDQYTDVRIKMCINPTEQDLVTIHHELGHVYYYLAYRNQDVLFRGGANDGFHEALGDLMALSVTPEYLERIGLVQDAKTIELNFLMKRALDKVAFLPWGLLVDKWRWGVFRGEIPPARYNEAWWQLRRTLQGIDAPVTRTAMDFDPGAKYHIPSNTPYMRYFLADILQFQFHRALCRAAGHTGPLYACSIYENKKVGERLRRMMAMGASRPWQDALEALTGERRMDASAIIEYFEPLVKWLEKRNAGRKCGW